MDNLKKWKWFEYFIFFALIPLIIIFIYPFSKNFALDLNSPNLINIFMSNYAHSSLEHLVGNLIPYFLVMFAIFNFETSKKRFYKMCVADFVLIPFILFAVMEIFVKIYHMTIPPMLGFSGICAFLIGYFTYTIYRYLKNIFTNLKLDFLMLLLLANVFYWLIVSGLVLASIIAAFAISLLMCNNKEFFKEVFAEISDTITSKKDHITSEFYKALKWTLAIAFIFSLNLLIPQRILIDGAMINILEHYVGYLFGIGLPIIPEIYAGIIKHLSQ